MPDGAGAGLTLVIAEGVGTALSLRESNGQYVLAALSCNNLEAVARAMRERYPAARIVICGDLGIGQSSATKAARIVRGFIASPDFGDGQEGDTHFNDMHRRQGIAAVRAAVANAKQPATGVDPDERV